MPFEPLRDWEETNNAISAIATIVEMGLGIWRALRGEKGEDEKDDEAEKELTVGVVSDEGLKEVPLGQLLGDHEARLRALEAPAPAPEAPPRARKRRRARSRA